jgi:hypothetical protein
MAKTTENTEKKIDIQAFLREQLAGIDEKDASEALEKLSKELTKELKIVKSSIVNEHYQKYIDNLAAAKDELTDVFEKSKDVIILLGQKRTPTPVKLVGYNSATGDIFVEYKNERGQMETKIVKEKSVISDISRIPVARKKANPKGK